MKQRLLPGISAFVTAILCLVVVYSINNAANTASIEHQRSEALNTLSTTRARLEAALYSRLFLTKGLVVYVATHKDITQEEFERYARELLGRDNSIRAIELAKDSVISHLYPVKGNEKVLGLNLLEGLPDEQREALRRAITTRKTIVAGPVELIQGGNAFISRTPVYVADSPDSSARSYWGIALVIILSETLYNEAGLQDINNELIYAIRGKDGLGTAGELFLGSEDIYDNDPVHLEVTIPNGTWELSAIPRQGWTRHAWSGVIWNVGVLVSFIIFILVYILVSTPQRLRVKVKQATAQLEASQQQQKALLNGIPDAAWLKDREGRFQAANKTFARQVKLDIEDIIGKTEFDLVDTESAEKYQRTDAQVIADRKALFLESEEIDAKGETRWVETVKVPIENAKGDIVGTAGIAHDVTNRHKAEALIRTAHAEAEHLVQRRTEELQTANQQLRTEIEERLATEKKLRMQRNQFQSLASNLPDSIFRLNKHCQLLFTNTQAEENWFSRAGTGAVTRLSDSTLPPDILELWERVCGGVASSGRPQTIEFAIPTPSGLRYFEGRYIPEFNDQNEVESILALNRDVTEAKEAADNIRRNEAQYRSLVDHASDGIFLNDRDGNFIDCNKAGLHMLGYAQAEIHTLTIFDVLQQRSRGGIKASLEELLDGKTLLEELELSRKDGSLVPVEISAVMLENGILQAIVRDISQRKRAEEEKQNVERHLQQQQKLEAIGSLASGVAHEINNPLNIIMNYAQLILDATEDDNIVSDNAGEILQEGERIATIVRNLLDFSRKEADKTSAVAMNSIVTSTQSLMHKFLARDQVTVSIDIPTNLPLVNCNKQQIMQVLINLFTNARDALNSRYPGFDENKKLIVTASRITKDGIGFVRTTIEDHGSGVPADIASRIFDPFFTSKGRDLGTGLGLSISYDIVKKHGGELSMESIENHVTRFFLDLPVARPEDD